MASISSYLLEDALSGYFAAVGLACLLGTAAMLLKRIRLLLTGSRAEGSVISLQARMQRHQREKISYMPVVRFNAAGKRIEFQSWAGGPSRRPVGSRVQVVYPDHAPQRALIVGALDLWVPPVALAILGIGSMAAAVKA